MKSTPIVGLAYAASALFLLALVCFTAAGGAYQAALLPQCVTFWAFCAYSNVNRQLGPAFMAVSLQFYNPFALVFPCHYYETSNEAVMRLANDANLFRNAGGVLVFGMPLTVMLAIFWLNLVGFLLFVCIEISGFLMNLFAPSKYQTVADDPEHEPGPEIVAKGVVLEQRPQQQILDQSSNLVGDDIKLPDMINEDTTNKIDINPAATETERKQSTLAKWLFFQRRNKDKAWIMHLVRRLVVVLIFSLAVLYDHRGLFALIPFEVLHTCLTFWLLGVDALPLAIADLIVVILMAVHLSTGTIILGIIFVETIYLAAWSIKSRVLIAPE